MEQPSWVVEDSTIATVHRTFTINSTEVEAEAQVEILATTTKID